MGDLEAEVYNKILVVGADAPLQAVLRDHLRESDDFRIETAASGFEAGIRAEISHIKLSGPVAWGQANKVLARIENARAEGLDITADQYVYTASSTGISQLVPEEVGAETRDREHLALRVAAPQV